jgi:hypothetical protein
LDYRISPFAKTYQAGDFGGYRHIKKPHRVKRSMSAGNFNFNLLVNERAAKDDEINLDTSGGNPLNKLRKFMGEDKLEMIRNEKPDLYQLLMDFLNANKTITQQQCKELVIEYELTMSNEADVNFHK